MILFDRFKKPVSKQPLTDKESSIEPAAGQAPETADSTSSGQHPTGHPPQVQSSQGVELVNESRIWYFDQYKRAVTFAIAVVIALIISLLLNTIQHISRPSPKYFALTNDLRVVELTPTDKANVSQEKLLNWVSETVCRTFTLDFLNYRDVLMGVRPNYTQGCYDSLTKSLETSGNLDMILEKRLVTRAVLNGAPLITKEAVVKGYRWWKIELPIVITYESSQGVESSQNLVGMLKVRREDENTHPRGVLIHQLVLQYR